MLNSSHQLVDRLQTETDAIYNYEDNTINYKGVKYGGHFPPRYKNDYIYHFIILYNQPIFKKIENKPISEQIANKLRFWDKKIRAFIEDLEGPYALSNILYSYNGIRSRWVPGYPTLEEFEELVRIELELCNIKLKCMNWIDT